MGSNEQSERGNPKQCRKGMTLPCTSVYNTPFERIFCAEQFGIWYIEVRMLLRRVIVIFETHIQI